MAILCLGLLVVGLAIMPLDPMIAGWFAGLPKRGDLWREIGAWQQYGQGGSIVIGVVLIWVLDPDRRRRLLDWLASGALVWLAVFIAKVLIGRPRPKLEDPYGFLWPWGTWDFGPPTGSVHAWQIGKTLGSELWSMPSSHTAFAVVMSVFLVRLYPRLRGVAVFMACLVGFARVAFGAHYPSDVFIGAAMGWILAKLAVGGFWGVRAFDWVWSRAVDRQAEPAWPGVVARERAAGRTG